MATQEANKSNANFLASPKGLNDAGVPRVLRATKQRKFYLFGSRSVSRPAGWKLVNKAELFGDRHPLILTPPGPFDRGFRTYPVPPRFHVSTRFGRNLADFEQNGEYWLVSDRAKRVLSEISDTDFAFLACDTEVDPGKDPITLWLCDVMPMLDAVDESRSDIKTLVGENGVRVYQMFGSFSMRFHESIIGAHHAFRLQTNFGNIVVDDFFKHAIKKSGLTGLIFRDAAAF